MPASLKRRWPLYALITCALGLALSLLALLTNPRTSAVIPTAIATPAPPTIVTTAPTNAPFAETATVTDVVITPNYEPIYADPSLPPITTDERLTTPAYKALVMNTQTITISDTYSMENSAQAHYTLQRTTTGFKGQGLFSSAQYNKGVVRDISLSVSNGFEFLQRLAVVAVLPDTATLGPDNTVPSCDETVTMVLQTLEGSAQFSTTACENWSTEKTWRVEYAGRQFYTYSYDVWQAYDLLKEYLRPDVLYSLRQNQTPAP